MKSATIKSIISSSNIDNREIDEDDEIEGIGSLVIGLQGITEFMSGVGSNVTHFDPLIYPTNQFVDEINVTNTNLIGANSLSINQLQSSPKLYFLPQTPVMCKIIDVERIVNFSDLDYQSNYLYTIRCKHGQFVWQIIKRYRHFYLLHKALVKYVNALLGVSVQDAISREHIPEANIVKLPLPSDLISGLNRYSIQNRKHALETYLNALLIYPKFKNHYAMLDFLEVSVLSFISELGPRYKEGKMKKRPLDDLSGRRWWLQIPLYCNCYNIRHQLRWFAVKESYITYIRPSNNELGFPMLIDRGFNYQTGFRNTASQSGLKIENLQRKMYLKAQNLRELKEWVESLNKILHISRCFIICSRFNSFAPVRNSCHATWFVNGRSYMEKVCDAILKAKEQIFITDWWLSPEVVLTRFKDGNRETWRLDELLAKKADEHVCIYVLLFKEVRFALSIDSLHSKVALRSRNPQFIKVIRHPDHNAGTLLWSHHEKSVVIDQTIAFVGGIDLCFGRWDDRSYRLVDLGSENDRRLLTSTELVTPTLSEMMKDRTGNIFAEKMLASTTEDSEERNMNLKDGNKTGFKEDKKHYKNMWHEARQAVRKKSYREFRDDDSDDEIYETDKTKNIDKEVEVKDRIWIGKDYSNSYRKDFIDVKDYYIDNLNRSSEPRMPWHDEAAVVLGDAAQDVARHFIQRWNQAKREKHRENTNYPYLLPKAYSIDPPNDEAFESLYNTNVQVLRSVGQWSAGITIVESSIMNACCNLIESAKHYVLIENQFFITSTVTTDVVKNGIGKAIYERIARAHGANESFKIYVILPLLPGFDSKQAIQAIQHFTMKSISVGENCIFEKLRRVGGVSNPSDYIGFFAMRNWDILMGKLVSEVIYVHSKLMIADDSRAVVGSANINDRSLLGSRDSELALLIEDNEFNKGTMNGQVVNVGRFCCSWRKAIFSQALGYTNSEIDDVDPACDEFFTKFKQIAQQNTDTFIKVFGCIPNDHIRTFAQLKEWQTRSFLSTTNPAEALTILRDNIQGYIVELPLYFLYDEDYYPLTKTREGLAPYVMWT